jgi:hypothetical protein
VFAHFTLPNIHDVSRRTISAALVVGVAILVGCVSFGLLLVGVGACIGVALGAFNFRMTGNSVAKASESEVANKKRPLALNTLGRLGIITVVTLGLLLVSHKLGLGILVGLAVFQVLLLVNVARSMAQAGPMTSVDDTINANIIEEHTDYASGPPAIESGDDPHGDA